MTESETKCEEVREQFPWKNKKIMKKIEDKLFWSGLEAGISRA